MEKVKFLSEQPFDIVTKPVESTPYLDIGLPHFDRWLGNANRSIVKHLFTQINTVKINQNWVDLMIQGPVNGAFTSCKNFGRKIHL